MAQHDYDLANAAGAAFRGDLNDALSAIATNNSGATEPATTFAGMLWLDTTNDLLKIRNETNSGWVTIAKLDGSGWTPYRQGTALGTAATRAAEGTLTDGSNLPDGAAVKAFVVALGDLAVSALYLSERSDHVNTPAAGKGEFWVRDDAPCVPVFTDDAGTDFVLASKAYVDSNAGGLTLLDTVNTTSGTAPSSTGLDLTGYKMLHISISGADHSSGTFERFEIEGADVGDGVNASPMSKLVMIDLTNGGAMSASRDTTGLTTTSTSITFGWEDGATFTAGVVKIWGVK